MLHNASIYLSDFKAVANQLMLFLMQLNLITCKWLYQKLMHNFQYFLHEEWTKLALFTVEYLWFHCRNGEEQNTRENSLTWCCLLSSSAANLCMLLLVSFSLSHFEGLQAASLNQKLPEMFFSKSSQSVVVPSSPPTKLSNLLVKYYMYNLLTSVFSYSWFVC